MFPLTSCPLSKSDDLFPPSCSISLTRRADVKQLLARRPLCWEPLPQVQPVGCRQEKRLLCTAAKEAQRRNNELIMFASVCRDHKSQLWLDCDTQITRVNFKHVTDTHAEGGAFDHMGQKNKPRWIACHLCFITAFTSRKNTSYEEKKNRIKVQMTHFWVLFCGWCHGRGRTSSVYDDLFWLANYKDIVLCAFRKQTIYSRLRLPSVVK